MQKNFLIGIFLLIIIFLVFYYCIINSSRVSDQENSSQDISSMISSEENSSDAASSIASDQEESASSKEPESAPLSIHFAQMDGGGYFLWELDITDKEEIELLVDLLSVEGLSLLDPDYSMWPDGEIPITFQIIYDDKTVSGACNPDAIDAYRHAWGWDWTIITGPDEDENRNFYAYPYEKGDRLLEFLENKGITVN